MYTIKSAKECDGNAFAIRPAERLQSPGKKVNLSWLRKIIKQIKIDQRALRKTLEVTFWR